MVKLLEFSTKKIARQEAQAEALKPTRRAIFSWRALALVLQRLLLAAETLSADQPIQAVNLLLVHLPKSEHILQFEGSGHGQKSLGSKCCDDSKWHQGCVLTQPHNARRDEQRHHDDDIGHSRHLQSQKEHDSPLSRGSFHSK